MSTRARKEEDERPLDLLPERVEDEEEED